MSTPAPLQNFEYNVYQGCDFAMALQFSDDSGSIDITGWQIKCVIAAGVGSPALLTFTQTIQNQTTNKGQAVLSLTGAQVKMLVLKETTKGTSRLPTDFVSDIVTVNTSGQEVPWATGVFHAYPMASD